jgi:hypothetical protein
MSDGFFALCDTHLREWKARDNAQVLATKWWWFARHLIIARSVYTVLARRLVPIVPIFDHLRSHLITFDRL